MARPKGSRHGLEAPMVRVRLRGFKAIDRRTLAARAGIEFRRELLSDLGGEETLTAARMALVESATRTWLHVQHLDAWCLEQSSLVNGRRKGVHPIVRERLLLVESLQRTLLALGLDRVPKAPKSLEQIASEIEAGRQEGPRTDGGHMEASEGAMSAPGPVSHDLGAGNEPPEQAPGPGGERLLGDGGHPAPGPERAGGGCRVGDVDGLAPGPEQPTPAEAGAPPATSRVAEAAAQAARRILGEWRAVPEQADPDPVGSF